MERSTNTRGPIPSPVKNRRVEGHFAQSPLKINVVEEGVTIHDVDDMAGRLRLNFRIATSSKVTLRKNKRPSRATNNPGTATIAEGKNCSSSSY